MTTQKDQLLKTVVFGTAIGLSLGVTLSWTSWFSSSNSSVETATVDGEKTTASAMQQNTDLPQQLELLRRKNTQLEAQQKDVTSKLAELQDKYQRSLDNLQQELQHSSHSAGVYSEPTVDQRHIAEDTTDIATANEAATKVRNHSLSNALIEQDRDPSWSDMAVNQITTAVSSGQFPGSSIVTTECKSTLCYVDVSHDSYPDMQKFLDQFPASLGWSDSSGQFETLGGDGELLTRMYLSRSGHDLPPDVKRRNPS